MRLTLPVLILAKLAVAGAAQPPAELQKAVDSALYRIQRRGEGYSAVNHRQNLQMRFTGEQSELVYHRSRLRLSLASEGPVLRSVAEGKRISFQHARVTEWFVNEPAGLEQGFTVASRQRADGRLSLTLDTGGDLRPALSGQEIVFRNRTGTVLRYAGLKSWDRDGHVLPSRAIVDDRRLRIEVDDRGASYPVIVDPVIQQPALIGSDAAYADAESWSVALSSDGATALVGAPISNSGPGAAYVFIRSGSTWTQQTKLTGGDTRSNSFGYAVALSADGNTALVGANGGPGAAYVFTRSGNTWGTPVELTDPVSHGLAFGYAVALSADGKTALVGVVGVTAYVFTFQNDSWKVKQNLLTSNVTRPVYYGCAVALSGDGNTALVGDTDANEQGAVAVFTRSGVTWTEHAPLTAATLSGGSAFGGSVALNGDGTTALVGAYKANGAYVFTGGGSAWTEQQILTDARGTSNDQFAYSVALSGDGNLALVGAWLKYNAQGAVEIYTRSAGVWTAAGELTPSDNAEGRLGWSVALSSNGNMALAGAISANGQTGAAYPFALANISLVSMPAGRSFTVGGTGCVAGTFSTPYSGYWSVPCSVQWLSPDLQTSGTRYTLQNWSDGDTENPRTLAPLPLSDATLYPYTADFLTEYQLATVAAPGTGGQLSPPSGNWYVAGSSAAVVALPSPGFVFTGYSGGLTGETSPQTLAMNGPSTVTANFTATPPSAESAVITAKSGPANERQWTLSVTNSGPGTAYAAQLVGLIFTQTFGTACTPLRDSPLLPVSLGDIASGSSAQTPVTLNLSSCPSNARFSVGIMYVANGGSAGGTIQLANQLQ